MVKCDSCVLSHDVRSARPDGRCEDCRIVTPHQDRLCRPCSEAHSRCQVCRSKRVQALRSVPTETVPIIQALEQAARQRANSYAQHEEEAASGSYASIHGGSQSARQSPRSSRPSTSRSAYASTTAIPTPQFLATSPFHFQNGQTYELSSADFEQLSLMAPAAASSTSSSGFDPSVALLPHSEGGYGSHHEGGSSGGLVILSPSGKLKPSTLTPLSPRMATQQNARGVAPQIRDESDARALVDSWPRVELVSTIFHYYCNHKSTRLQVQLGMNKFRHFAMDAGLVGPADAQAGVSALASNRLDILYTQCTRPLSGQKSLMTEGQFFESLGQLSLWRYGGGDQSTGVRQPSLLVPCLDILFSRNLAPLAAEIVQARRGGIFLRNEEFEPIVASVLLRYEEPLKKIFVRFARTFYCDAPRADETLSHPLLAEGWRAFCREYDFFPTNVSVTTVLKVFMATASGVALNGNVERPAQSFDDFMHAIFQLAQVAFTLTTNALPIERVELALSKIDSKSRELAYQPIGPRARTDSFVQTQKMLKPSSHADGQMVPYKGEHELQKDGAYDALYSLFSSPHMSCARDLFNLFCNTASQSSYTEILTRVQWVKLMREARAIDGKMFTSADPDIVFNKVLASASQAQSSRSNAFSHTRTMTFPLFLTGLLDVSSRRYPHMTATSAVRQLFQDFLEPLLQSKIEDLHQSAAAVELPLGAGLNSSGMNGSGTIHSPGNWGKRGFNSQEFQQTQLLLTAADGSTNPHHHTGQASAIYPNHPSFLPPVDVNELLAHDPDIQSLLHQYAKPLERFFFRASWEGVEAVNGASIPRLNSSLFVHGGSGVTSQNQLAWDQFLQQKNLLSEHACRRWLAQLKVVPELLAHKQVTMLFREGNIGFDRSQDQFVLNFAEFQATLLRIALLAFSSTAYVRYVTPVSKFELLFFHMDQNSSNSFGFRAFRFMPPPVDSQQPRGDAQDYNFALMNAASNMGNAMWERKSATELGVRALLMNEAADEANGGYSDGVISHRPSSIPQHWGHGEKSVAPIASPSHATAPLHNFNTSMLAPRVQFATEYCSPSPGKRLKQIISAGGGGGSNPQPNSSPTRTLFQATPFPVSQRLTTKFSTNAPQIRQ